MKKILLLPLLLLINNLFGQIVSSNAFLQGTYVEVGMAPCGTFGSSIAPPAGYHPRGGSGRLGFVADVGQDGWAAGTPNYVGDYFLPGSPEEGFGLTVNGVNYNNNQVCSETNIPGSIISYTTTSSEISTVWQGSVAGLSIAARTYLPINSLYFITEVTVTNTSASAINNIYYMRNVDPDHEQPLTGNFATANAVVYQNPNACNQALVSATGLTYGSYLGLGSIDPRAHVTMGGFSNRSAISVWNGTGLFTSGTHTSDEAISISFNLGSLAANEATTFAYAYILNASQLTQALAATNITFEANGVTYSNGNTGNICSGTPVPINLSNTGTYTSWTWSPATGLNTTVGTSVLATLTSPVTYIATGTGACGTVNVSITLNPVIVPTPGNAGPITGPSTASLGQTNLTYSISPVTDATAYNWTLPPGAIVTSSSSTSNSITFKASNVSWCGDIVVEPINACNSGGSSSIPVCIGNSISTLTPATAMCAGSNNMVPFTASGSFNSGNVFTAQLSDANGDFSSPVNIGTYSSTGSGVMHTTIPASTPYGTGYRIRVVNSNPAGIGSPNPDDITISHPSAVVNSTTNVLCFNGLTGAADVNVTDGQAPYSYDWEPGNPTGDGSSAVSSLAAGSYTCTVTDVLGCSSTATLNITQPDELIVSATQTSPILCNGGLANIDVTAAGGAGGYAGTGSFTVSAGSYSYTVTDGNSCSSSALITVTEPTLLTASYTAGQINCFGGTASVVVSAAGGTTPYSGDGSFSQYAGTMSYPITDANGCTTSVTVALTEPSKVEGTIATTPTGCLGNDGTATITPSGGTGPYTYLWSDGQTTQTATGLISANYSVVITDGNGCTGAASAMVGASTGLLPAPGVIAGATSGVCRNTSGLVYSVAPVAGAVSYAWTLPNGATGVSNTNSITLSFTNAYAGGFLCVSAVNACGLGAASCVSIPVYATYASTPAPITGPSIVCGPGVYTFSTSSTNASGYNWTTSGTGVSIQSGQGTNTVQVSISSGFISGSLQVSASNCYGNSAVRGMLLYGIPTSMNPITGNIFVCPGGTTTFAMNLVPGITSYSWSISGDATLVTSSQNATQTTATFAMGSAWTTGSVTLTVANSCGSYSRSFSVFSVPGQPGSITGPNTGLCGLSNVTYSILAVPGATSYSWTVPAGVSIVNNTGLSITVNYTAAFTGSGSICVVPNNSCGSGPARCYGITSRLSIPTITGPASVCKSQSAVAYSATPIAGALSYTWSVTGGATITPAGTSATVNFNTTTSSPATVRVNANNACGASQPGIYNVTVNLACREAQQLNIVSDFESSVTLFPNPTSGKAEVTFELNQSLKMAIKITNIYGKLISQEEINAVEGINHHDTDLSNCAKGVYLLTLITSDGNSKTMRLIVE